MADPPDQDAAAGSVPAAVRRRPEQERSRQRVEQVLQTAAGLIAEVGVDAMTMSDLAEAADVSLPSIYRYFPSKQTIVRSLFERYAARVEAELVDAVGVVEDADDARGAVERAMRRYWELYRGDPALAAVWAAVVADPELVHLDVEDSRSNGCLLAAALEGVVPGAGRARLDQLAFLASHLAGAAVRLGVLLEDEAEAAAMIDNMVECVLPPLLGLSPPDSRAVS